MSHKHTPGPWQFDDGDSEPCGVFDAQGGAICYLTDLTLCGDDNCRHYVTGPTGQPDVANALLIAAAPDLLAALVDASQHIPVAPRLHPDDLSALQTRVLAAIDKAVRQ
jgi:hypothetical protein